MKRRVFLFLFYFLFWILSFLFYKALFLVFNFGLTKSLSVTDLLGVFLHGLRLDISAATYMIILPVLFILFLSYFKPKALLLSLRYYTLTVLVFVSFFVVADIELYKFWGFRLDTTPLLYINTPKEMLASVSVWMVVSRLILIAGLVVLLYFIYRRYIEPLIEQLSATDWKSMVLFAMVFCSLIIPIRGGVGIAPINNGTAYFSSNQFANHAAINVIWNVGFSLTTVDEMNNSYESYTSAQAQQITDSLYVDSKTFLPVLKTDKPNIIVIILESFTVKIIEPLGGLPNITPNLNKLCQEGICFTNFYASGDRSDKGIVAIISGFPALPKTSIIKYSNKTEKLPFLTRDLAQKGYNKSFYYGGDIDFASIRSYLKNGSFDQIIDKTVFPPSDYNSKWGVHDHLIFNKLYDDVASSKSPFMKVFFTLSSHEPFDVPMKTVIGGTDDNHKFLNAAYYTDSCLGHFIDRARKSSWWNNTLIIITADHGTPRPDDSPAYSDRKYKIPLLWLGGALAVTDTMIAKTGSQTDIAVTLLAQLNIEPKVKYTLSKNLLGNQQSNFAFYSYNNGFGFITDSSKVVYDENSKQILIKQGNVDKSLRQGKAFLQSHYDDFLKK